MFKFQPRRLAICVAIASSAFAAQSVAEVTLPDFYGSLRGQMSLGSSDNQLEAGSSRIGLRFNQEVRPGVSAFARVEMGISMFDGGDPFWSRLGFIGAEHEQLGRVSFGKQWSVFYDVAGASEQLFANGGDVTGIYGTLTNSTARSDNALQYNNTIAGLSIGLQVQNPNEFNNSRGSADLDRAYTGALRYAVTDSVEVGVAHTRATILSADAALGLKGDTSSSTAASFKGYFSDLEVTVAVAESQNHVQDGIGKFYDARGAEAFVGYNTSAAQQVYVGYNYQAPKNSNDTEERTRYASIGTNYHWNESFQTFAEVKFDQGTDAWGEDQSSRVYFGGWYNF